MSYQPSSSSRALALSRLYSKEMLLLYIQVPLIMGVSVRLTMPMYTVLASLSGSTR